MLLRDPGHDILFIYRRSLSLSRTLSLPLFLKEVNVLALQKAPKKNCERKKTKRRGHFCRHVCVSCLCVETIYNCGHPLLHSSGNEKIYLQSRDFFFYPPLSNSSIQAEKRSTRIVTLTYVTTPPLCVCVCVCLN